MTPEVEVLESRCVLNAANLGTIEAVGHVVLTCTERGESVGGGPNLSSAHFAQIDYAAYMHEDGNVRYVDPGKAWDVFVADWMDEWHDNWGNERTTRFVMPEAASIGLSMHGDQITVYQVCGGSLWSVTSTDAGWTWGQWGQVVPLPVTPPDPTLPLSALQPFGFDGPTVSVDEESEDGALVGENGPAERVWGRVVEDQGVVYVGWLSGTTVRAAKVTNGELEEVAVDAFFADWTKWEAR